MRAISDRATTRLVEKAVQGDEQAFARLCEAFAKDILYLCVKIMGNKPDGEDAAQETYIKMQKSITKLENPQAFSAWLHRVVVSACNDVHRKRGRWSQEDPIENYQEILTEGDINALPQERTEKGSEKAILLQAVNSLSDQHRTMVLLYYYKGISQKEIADAMDTTVNAVGHSLRRAKDNIRKHLEVSFGSDAGANDTRLGAVVTSALLAESAQMFQPAEILAPLQLAGIETAAGGWFSGLVRMLRGALPAAHGGKVALAALSVTTATAVLVATQAASPGISDYTLPQSAETNDMTVEIPQIALPEDLELAGLEIEGPAAATLPAGKVAASPASSSSSASSSSAGRAASGKPADSSTSGDESASLAHENTGRDTPAAQQTTASAAPVAPAAPAATAPPAPTASPAPPAPAATPAPPAAPAPNPELTAGITFYGTDGSVTSRNPARAAASAHGGSGTLTYSWVCWDLGAGGYMTGSGSTFDIMPNGVSPDTTMEISFRLELTVVDSNGNTATAEGHCSIGRP